MLRIILSPEQRAALQALRRDPTLRPADRDRVEMLALSATGWPVGAIAGHLGYHPETVRRLFRRFPGEGLATVRHRPPGPPEDAGRRARIAGLLEGLLGQERTWTAAQLAGALREHGFRLSARQLRRYLRNLAAWRRTQRTLRHKQDAERAAQAREELAFFDGGRRRAS